jgi:hypothetical protein
MEDEWDAATAVFEASKYWPVAIGAVITESPGIPVRIFRSEVV